MAEISGGWLQQHHLYVLMDNTVFCSYALKGACHSSANLRGKVGRRAQGIRECGVAIDRNPLTVLTRLILLAFVLIQLKML